MENFIERAVAALCAVFMIFSSTWFDAPEPPRASAYEKALEELE